MVAPVESRRFVGRDAELEQLHEWRRAAAKGRPSLILIGGEAGLGKSRLLREFTRSLTGGRAPLLAQAECLERAPRPLGPFRRLVATIVEAVPALAAEGTPRMRHVLRHVLPDTAVDAPPDSRPLDKADLFAGVHELFGTIARKRATVFTIEDLHWADAVTLELLEYLAPRLGSMRLAILATLRDDVLPDGSSLGVAVGRLEREHSVYTLSLQPLSKPALRKLLESARAGGSAVGEATLRDIERRSDGNPLCAEELLKTWLESGAHRRELPRSILALIAERVARLNASERRVLMHAAVLGQQFDASVLARILECRIERLTPALQRARELNLLVEDTGSLAGFRFRHALTRQALYESQLALTLRPLHGRIARTLEALPDAPDRLDELAYHWWQADSPERAQHYNERAGFAALKLCAYADAAIYLERTLSLCDEPLERARLMSVLGAAYRSQGNPEAAVRWCLDAAAAFAAADRPSEAIAPLLFGCAELGNANRVDEARAELERFLARYGERLAPAARGRLRCDLVLMQAHRIDIAQPTTAAIALEDELGAFEDDARMRYWTARMTLHAQLGEVKAWGRAVGEARALLDSDARGPLLNQSSTIQYIGLTALQLAQHEEAGRALADSRELADAHGLHSALTYLEALHAMDAFLAGRLAEARDAARIAAEDARSASARSILGCAGPLIGLALGDDALVEHTLYGQSAHDVLAYGLRSYSDLACGSVAAAWLASDRAAEAIALLEAAVTSIVVVLQGQFIWPIAAEHIKMSSLTKLLDTLNRTRANPEHAVAHAVADHVSAIAGRRTGNTLRQNRHAAEAAARYRALGWPLFEAQALELANRCDDARAIYQRCGSVADLRRLDLRSDARSPRLLPSKSTGSPLSRREREVAALVAACLTNRAVAARLDVGEKTIERHLSSIYAKLGFRSRAQLIAHSKVRDSPHIR